MKIANSCHIIEVPITATMKLLCVTEKSHPPQDPVVWMMVATEVESCDVRQVSATRFLVDWTDVELGIIHVILHVDGEYVDYWNLDKQDFQGRLNQAAVSFVPACTIQVQTVYVDPFLGGTGDVLFHHLGYLIVDNDAVQGPPLVCPRHFLSHGRHETLGVEEASHPETVGTTFEDPAAKLCVPLQQLCVPETNSGGVPRNLHRKGKREIVVVVLPVGTGLASLGG